MKWLDRILHRNKKSKIVKQHTVWDKQSGPTSSNKSLRSYKIHVPGLRTAKRVIAVFLLIINFFIAQSALTSALATQPLYWLFFFNVLILIDYLWKTRRVTP